MEKDLQGKIEDLLRDKTFPETSSENVEYFAKGYDTFLKMVEKKNKGKNPMDVNFGAVEEAGGEIADYCGKYTFDDVQTAATLIVPGEGDYDYLVGIYFSSLINKIIKHNDEFTLTLDYHPFGLGTSLEKGTLIIDGSVGSMAGWFMKGGNLIVKGDAGPYAGAYMHGGKLVIEGNAMVCLACFMTGGEIWVEGNIDGQIVDGKTIPHNYDFHYATYSRGNIYHKGKKVWDIDKFNEWAEKENYENPKNI